LTDLNNFCTKNELLTKYSHLLTYYFNSILRMTSSKRHSLLMTFAN